MTEAPMPRYPWLPLAVFMLGLAAAGWRIPEAPPPVLASSQAEPVALRELPPTARLSPERVSLTRLPNGHLAAAWLEQGDAGNAAIRLAINDGKSWQEMGRIASRESTAATTFMHTQGLGHPVLWSEGGWLHLWYEAYPLGRGGGASIIHSLSTDGGRNWNRSQRLSSSPFGGFGSRLGLTPRELADGGLLLPLGPNDEDGPWLRLAATGQIIGKLERLPVGTPREPAR
jgi:hypothetical protein